MQKRLRGLDEIQQRLDSIEERLDKLEASTPTKASGSSSSSAKKSQTAGPSGP